MTADLRFVMHAAQTEAHELAAQRPRDRLSQTRLADTRRTDEEENRLPRGAVDRGLAGDVRLGLGHDLALPFDLDPDIGGDDLLVLLLGRLAILAQLAHRQVLEDAVLDLLQVVVVFVEDLPRPGDVDLAAAQLVPGQLRDPVEIGADDAVLR